VNPNVVDVVVVLFPFMIGLLINRLVQDEKKGNLFIGLSFMTVDL
jgi:hypothetical protein